MSLSRGSSRGAGGSPARSLCRRAARTTSLEPLPMTDPLLLQTRRHFFRDCALGVGSMALTSLLNGRPLAAAPQVQRPLAPRQPHFAPRAKSVIYLFMAGGPSQLEMFDYKPKLMDYDGKPMPDEFIKGKRFAFMDTFAKEHP